MLIGWLLGGLVMALKWEWTCHQPLGQYSFCICLFLITRAPATQSHIPTSHILHQAETCILWERRCHKLFGRNCCCFRWFWMNARVNADMSMWAITFWNWILWLSHYSCFSDDHFHHFHFRKNRQFGPFQVTLENWCGARSYYLQTRKDDPSRVYWKPLKNVKPYTWFRCARVRLGA